MTDVAAALSLAALIVGLAAGTYGLWRRFRPGVRRASSALDAIIGKEAVTDRAGNLIEPAKPGLVHRTTTLEQTIATLVNQDERIKHIERDHGARIKALEDVRLDKLIGQVESANMWRAVADRDIEDVE